jgi:glycosyltransferase involved in cell wall biosynthesis
MIVGLFNDSFPPVIDGVAITVKNYAYWINKKYGLSYVITPAYPKYKDNEEFEVIRYFSLPLIFRPPYRLGIPFLDINAMKKIEKIPFDIIHAHSPFSTGVLGLYIARKKKIPIVATFHTKYYDDFKEATKSELIAQIAVKLIVEFYNQVDEVWTVNYSTAETLRSYGFKKNIKIMPNGTDFIPPDNPQEYREKINKIHNLKEDEFLFLFVGQIIKQKNIELLLKSFKILKERGYHFKAILIGTGKDEKYFKDLTHKLNLEENVIFTGKILDRELLKAYYARADLFTFPSLYDTSAIVLQEASALKCPSLVIESSNIAEEIIDGYNGFLSQNDPYIYAEKISQIISDRKRLKSIGENAQKTLYKPWEKIVDEVMKRYKEILNSKKEYIGSLI